MREDFELGLGVAMPGGAIATPRAPTAVLLTDRQDNALIPIEVFAASVDIAEVYLKAEG